MNLLDILSTGELYKIAGYSKKLHKENLAFNSLISDNENYDPETKTGYSGIFDWSSMQYINLSTSVKKILGYDREFFLLKGINFLISIVHPLDLEHLKEIHLCIFNYYYNTPIEQRAKLRFSYNMRLRTADHSYVKILRQSTFAKFTDDGKPMLEYINCTDITGFRFNNAINLTVHRLSAAGTFVLCYETEFAVQQHQLSKREKEVLDLAKQGYTTKEIASKLYLCIETVKSHRKHIIAKTGGGNMAAAINKITRL